MAVKKNVDTKVEGVKTEVVKEEKAIAAPKVAPAVKAPAKTTAPKAAPAPKATTKAAPKAEKKAPAKTTTKPATKSEFAYVQFDGKEIDIDVIVESAKADYKTSNKAAIKKIEVYVKPEDSTAYYVVNGKISGKVSL